MSLHATASRMRHSAYLARRAELSLRRDSLGSLLPQQPAPRDDALNSLEEPVLIVGAGGLGVEMLKNIALLGFSNIALVDMDTISLTNLNRQFIFREKDIGMYKANVAASWVQENIPGVSVKSHACRIEDLGPKFLCKFKIILLGLDSVDVRRWINSAIQNERGIILLESGSEGMKGHARVIKPNETACYECTLGLLNEPSHIPLCTLAARPRDIQHCVLWALLISWPRENPNVSFDGSLIQHLEYISENAVLYAKKFNIPHSEITPFFIRGVVNKIVPAVASTNAIVAGMCAAEAYKIATGCTGGELMQNFTFFAGDAREAGIHAHTFAPEKMKDCPVCGVIDITVNVPHSCTVREFLEHIKFHTKLYELGSLSISNESGPIYIPKPPFIEVNYHANLLRPIAEFAAPHGNIIKVSSPGVDTIIAFKIVLAEDDSTNLNSLSQQDASRKNSRVVNEEESSLQEKSKKTKI